MKTATMMTSKSAAQRLWHSRFEWWTMIVREGVVAGTLGGAIVALWYLLCDTIGGRPFHTPALLGASARAYGTKVVAGGRTAPSACVIWPRCPAYG